MSDTTPNPFQSPYPGVRRIITGHKPSGEATVIRDELKPPVIWDPAVPAPVYSVYQSNETPAKNDAEFTPEGWVDTMPDLPGPDSIISRNGSTLRVFDLQPGAVSPHHRTHSLDYGIVAKGTLVMELENGERTILKEGDIVVQRGTIHTWRNESTEWVRIYFILLDAHPIEVNGKKLPEEWNPASEK